MTVPGRQHRSEAQTAVFLPVLWQVARAWPFYYWITLGRGAEWVADLGTSLDVCPGETLWPLPLSAPLPRAI